MNEITVSQLFIFILLEKFWDSDFVPFFDDDAKLKIPSWIKPQNENMKYVNTELILADV